MDATAQELPASTSCLVAGALKAPVHTWSSPDQGIAGLIEYTLVQVCRTHHVMLRASITHHRFLMDDVLIPLYQCVLNEASNALVRA